MENEVQDMPEMATKPLEEHQWLQNLVGEWRVESELIMDPGNPESSKMKTEGTSSVKNVGGLWAYSTNKDTLPDGTVLESYRALGYDVSFKEYRGCMIMSASSHLWKYTGTLSADGKTMTMDCEGPDMVHDGQTAMYRDVLELIDDNHHTLTSFGQDEKGDWQQYAKAEYYRV